MMCPPSPPPPPPMQTYKSVHKLHTATHGYFFWSRWARSAAPSRCRAVSICSGEEVEKAALTQDVGVDPARNALPGTNSTWYVRGTGGGTNHGEQDKRQGRAQIQSVRERGSVCVRVCMSERNERACVREIER